MTFFDEMKVNDWLSWTRYDGDWEMKVGKYIQGGVQKIAIVTLYIITVFIFN